jgi:uncharacterized protein (DUF488 family)
VHGEQAVNILFPPQPLEHKDSMVKLRANKSEHLQNLAKEPVPDKACLPKTVKGFKQMPDTFKDRMVAWRVVHVDDLGEVTPEKGTSHVEAFEMPSIESRVDSDKAN